MEYSQLKTLIYDYLQVQGEPIFASDVDRIITLAEVRIAREVDTPDQKTTATGNIALNDGVIIAPLDFISPLSLNIGVSAITSHSPMLLKDQTFLTEAYGSFATGGGGTTGTPLYYSIPFAVFDQADYPPSDTQINFAPAADGAYHYELYYRRYPDTLVGGVAGYQTYLSKFFPQTLLYACLAEGYNFLKGDPAMQSQYEKWLQAGLLELRSAMLQQTNDGFRPAPIPTSPLMTPPQA